MSTALVLVPTAAQAQPTASRLDELRRAVLNGVPAENSRRNYALALDELSAFCRDREQFISRTLILEFRAAMLNRNLSASTINVKLSAVRKLVEEAKRAGVVSAEDAAQMVDVPNVRQQGTRLGNWLTRDQAKELLAVPDRSTLKGKRDYVILALLVGCALRRNELAMLDLQTIQLREGRWVIADLCGKGRRIRTVAVPMWVKQGVNTWMTAASIEEGRLLRRVSKSGKTQGDGLSDWAIWSVVEQAAKAIGIERFGAHDLRRTCAKLCRKAGGDLEQIKFLLGHSSIQTTERYLGSEHTSHVGVLADGRIMTVSVPPGAPVHRGQVLGTLHSHMVHETVGALVQAYAAVDRQRGAVAFAEQAQARYHHLYAIQAASLEESQRSDQEVLQAQKRLVDAEADVRMEREHLSELLQVPPGSLNAANLYDRELIPIRSPIDGVVIARNISVGQVVETGFDAFDVSDLSTVWVTAALSQQDLSLVHNGAQAQVVADGYPDQVFPGRVAMVGDMLDAQTRTIPVRVVVANPKTRLRPGMFTSAHLAEQSTRNAIFVPEEALQTINGMRVVFVTTDGRTFKARTVELGTQVKGKAEVVTGLSPGDRIVVNGAFMVKSQMLKGTMGEG